MTPRTEWKPDQFRVNERNKRAARIEIERKRNNREYKR